MTRLTVLAALMLSACGPNIATGPSVTQSENNTLPIAAPKPPAPEKPRLPGGYYTMDVYEKVSRYVAKRGEEGGTRK
jgi:hypothetical protein